MKTRNFTSLLVLLLGVLLLGACGGGGGGSSKFGVGTGNTTPETDNSADGVVIIAYESTSRDSLNLLGGGGIESTVVTFKITNSDDEPLAGHAVDFRLTSDVGGVSLLGNVTNASSNASGLVSVTVKAGTVPTSVRVIAKHTASGLEATSAAVNISSGIPFANSISISASPSWATESTRDKNNIEVTLNIIASDELGNPALDGIRFTFLSPEWGTFNQSSCTTQGGQCEVKWLSAAFWDKLIGPSATVMAYTDGAETYEDANGNNIYDAGESWTDLGEPFVDMDENGIWSTGEPWVDANKNGVYDVNGNGVWDGPCPEGEQFTCGTSSTVPIAIQGALFLCLTEDTNPICSNNN